MNEYTVLKQITESTSAKELRNGKVFIFNVGVIAQEELVLEAVSGDLDQLNLVRSVDKRIMELQSKALGKYVGHSKDPIVEDLRLKGRKLLDEIGIIVCEPERNFLDIREQLSPEKVKILLDKYAALNNCLNELFDKVDKESGNEWKQLMVDLPEIDQLEDFRRKKKKDDPDKALFFSAKMRYKRLYIKDVKQDLDLLLFKLEEELISNQLDKDPVKEAKKAYECSMKDLEMLRKQFSNNQEGVSVEDILKAISEKDKKKKVYDKVLTNKGLEVKKESISKKMEKPVTQSYSALLALLTQACIDSPKKSISFKDLSVQAIKIITSKVGVSLVNSFTGGIAGKAFEILSNNIIDAIFGVKEREKKPDPYLKKRFDEIEQKLNELSEEFRRGIIALQKFISELDFYKKLRVVNQTVLDINLNINAAIQNDFNLTNNNWETLNNYISTGSENYIKNFEKVLNPAYGFEDLSVNSILPTSGQRADSKKLLPKKTSFFSIVSNKLMEEKKDFRLIVKQFDYWVSRVQVEIESIGNTAERTAMFLAAAYHEVSGEEINSKLLTDEILTSIKDYNNNKYRDDFLIHEQLNIRVADSIENIVGEKSYAIYNSIVNGAYFSMRLKGTDLMWSVPFSADAQYVHLEKASKYPNDVNTGFQLSVKEEDQYSIALFRRGATSHLSVSDHNDRIVLNEFASKIGIFEIYALQGQDGAFKIKYGEKYLTRKEAHGSDSFLKVESESDDKNQIFEFFSNLDNMAATTRKLNAEFEFRLNIKYFTPNKINYLILSDESGQLEYYKLEGDKRKKIWNSDNISKGSVAYFQRDGNIVIKSKDQETSESQVVWRTNIPDEATSLNYLLFDSDKLQVHSYEFNALTTEIAWSSDVPNNIASFSLDSNEMIPELRYYSGYNQLRYLIYKKGVLFLKDLRIHQDFLWFSGDVKLENGKLEIEDCSDSKQNLLWPTLNSNSKLEISENGFLTVYVESKEIWCSNLKVEETGQLFYIKNLKLGSFTTINIDAFQEEFKDVYLVPLKPSNPILPFTVKLLESSLIYYQLFISYKKIDRIGCLGKRDREGKYSFGMRKMPIEPLPTDSLIHILQHSTSNSYYIIIVTAKKALIPTLTKVDGVHKLILGNSSESEYELFQFKDDPYE